MTRVNPAQCRVMRIQLHRTQQALEELVVTGPQKYLAWHLTEERKGQLTGKIHKTFILKLS